MIGSTLCSIGCVTIVAVHPILGHPNTTHKHHPLTALACALAQDNIFASLTAAHLGYREAAYSNLIQARALSAVSKAIAARTSNHVTRIT